MNSKTYVEINLDNINKNVKALTTRYSNYTYYIGVVKNDAYHHGLLEVSREIIKHGINYLMVSNLEDALLIREKHKNVKILCHGIVDYDNLNIASKNDITITVHNYDYFKELLKLKLKKVLKVHVKIDTGLNRLGFKDKLELEEALITLKNDKDFFLEGLYTELIDAANIDSSVFDDQINHFLSMTKDVDLSAIPMIHIYNTEALLNHPKLKLANAVRIGIGMYGINPVKHKEIDIKLHQTFSLYTEVIDVKEVKVDEAIGYENKYQTKRDIKIAIVPVGYGNGISHKNIGRNVSINGGRYKIIDDIYMDMLTLYVDDSIKIFDKVALIGDLITIDEIVNYLQIPYQEAFRITNIKRVYIKKD